jgi:hypothetical protein
VARGICRRPALQPGHLSFLVAPVRVSRLISPEFFRVDFAADLNPDLATELSDQLCPTSFGFFFDQPGRSGTSPCGTPWRPDRMTDPADSETWP